MKHIYSLILITIIFASCKDKEKTVADKTKSDLEFYKLKGDVKTVSEKTLAIDKTAGAPARENMSEYDTDYTFNESGMLIAQKRYLSKNTLFDETVYMGKDKITKHTQYVNSRHSVITDYIWDKGSANNLSVTKRNADNSQLDRVSMKYNAKGKVTERIVYNRQDLPVEKITYEYDDKGNLTTESFYLDQETVQVKNIYEYIGTNKVSEVKVKPDGSVIYKTFYEYNTDNKLVKSGTSNGEGKLQYSQDITYDKKGNIISQDVFEGYEGANISDKYTFDANNNKTSWANFVNKQQMFNAEYKYDKNNNLLSLTSTDTQSNASTSKSYAYEYDKKGNWIKKTTSLNNKPAFITTRTITYF